MSATIWTRCAGHEHARSLQLTAWRVVDSQSDSALRNLTRDHEDHALLERMIEPSKPPHPHPDDHRQRHFLLTTPFRYPPLRHGSRFATRFEPSLWYGASGVETAFAEKAYYRLRFHADSAANLLPGRRALTSFGVPVNTNTGIYLTDKPFDRYRARISDPGSYTASQPLGAAMRHAGTQAFTYWSARSPGVASGCLHPLRSPMKTCWRARCVHGR